MKNLINIVVLLCKDCDDNITKIDKIFDSIAVEDDKASFDIVTIINAVEYVKKKFSLFYYLVNLNEGKQAYIGEEAFEHLENEENHQECIPSSIEACSQKISVIKLEDVQFLSHGAHEILVYKYEDDEIEGARKTIEEKNPFSLQSEDKLVATYGFNVKQNV